MTNRLIKSFQVFFHHMTRENKLKTLTEVKRLVKPQGGLHIADWGLAANPIIKFPSRVIQIFDGFETTADNFNGLLPGLLADSGFVTIEETDYSNTLFGTIRLLRSRRP